MKKALIDLKSEPIRRPVINIKTLQWKVFHIISTRETHRAQADFYPNISDVWINLDRKQQVKMVWVRLGTKNNSLRCRKWPRTLSSQDLHPILRCLPLDWYCPLTLQIRDVADLHRIKIAAGPRPNRTLDRIRLSSVQPSMTNKDGGHIVSVTS